MVCPQGETAKGDWPEEAVETMAGVVREAEAACDQEQLEITQQVPTVVPTVTPHVCGSCSAAHCLLVFRIHICRIISVIAIGPVTL